MRRKSGDSGLFKLDVYLICLVLIFIEKALSFEMNGMTFTGEKYCNVPLNSQNSFDS